MIRAVLDTNVLVSAIVGFDRELSTPGEIFRRWQHGTFVLVVSPVILKEFERTLSNPYFRNVIEVELRYRALWNLRNHASLIEITTSVAGVLSHPEDDLILATAVSGEADYLMTGDRALQSLTTYRGIDIVSPRVFLTVLDGSANRRRSTSAR